MSSKSEVKRLMIQLRAVAEERNKFRDRCLESIGSDELFNEIMSAYEEGHADGVENGGDYPWDQDWENSMTFSGFLAEHSQHAD